MHVIQIFVCYFVFNVKSRLTNMGFALAFALILRVVFERLNNVAYFEQIKQLFRLLLNFTF